jgi:methylmalonyl-CoA/ethylmalonyl-CoA epimerase
MRLHHVGVVVRDIAAYGAAFEITGMHASSQLYYDPVQKVRIQFWSDAAGQTIELVEPAAADSPVQEALRKGGGLNHLCFEVDDLDAKVRELLERGGLPVCAATPAVAFGGRRIAFLFLPELNLVELVEAAR